MNSGNANMKFTGSRPTSIALVTLLVLSTLVAIGTTTPADPLDRIVGERIYLDTRAVHKTSSGYVFQRKLALCDSQTKWSSIERVFDCSEWTQSETWDGPMPADVYTSLKNPGCSVMVGWDDGIITPLTETRPATILEATRGMLRDAFSRH